MRVHGERRPPRRCLASIDHHGRYAFGNQPDIADLDIWRASPRRCCRCSPTIPGRPWRWPPRSSPRFPPQYRKDVLRGQRTKLGLRRGEPNKKPTAPTPRWPRTGWRSCLPGAWTSRSDGAGWPTPRRAMRHRCARCSRTRKRKTDRFPRGARAAPARTAARFQAAAAAGGERASTDEPSV